jgi:hypothetical protein
MIRMNGMITEIIMAAAPPIRGIQYPAGMIKRSPGMTRHIGMILTPHGIVRAAGIGTGIRG